MLDLSNIKKWIRLPRRNAATRVEDSLDAFRSENSASDADARMRPGLSLPISRAGLLVALTGLIAVAIAAIALLNWKPLQVEAASASLTIESVPPGADVLSGGAWKGKTPLTLTVNPGEHIFELLHDGHRKPLRAVARAGAAVVHHVEFESVVPGAPKKASLRITTEPSNLRVVVDGVRKGTSPVTIEEIAPGTHKVQVIGTSGTLERRVEVTEGESSSVIITAMSAPAPLKAAGPAAGWLTVVSPVALQIIEGKEIIGTSASSRIMLPTGRHDLTLTSAEIGFTERRNVQISAGQSASLKVQLPNAPLNINAVPWAEVWVDGVRLGETPIGNHKVRLGSHEIVFRHPEHGEKRQTVTVTLTKPARVSVDMRKPGS